ncbi:MAG: hypothetical protein K6B72_01445 [Lachnospiraceae bacterium]|nr:hypothetical protein [Lachnospiraceae bacterium]
MVVPADEAADFEESSADDNGDVVVAGSSAQTEDGDAQTADGNVTLVAAGGAAVQGQQVLGVNRTAAQDSSKKAAVLGVKREAGSEEIADSAEEIDETLLAEAEEITNETAETELVTIAEEEVALAKTFEQSGAQMNWWWLLLLLIVIALIVKKAYDDHRKKIEA